MSNEAVVALCRAREHLRERTRDSAGERAEASEAARTLKSLLQESMTRHDVRCIEIPASGVGPPTYVRVDAPAPRAAPRREGDVEAVVRGVGAEVAATPTAEVPDAIARRRRAPESARATSGARSGAARHGRDVGGAGPPRVPLVAAPNETQQLAQQLAEVAAASRRARVDPAPLRRAEREAEREAATRADRPWRCACARTASTSICAWSAGSAGRRRRWACARSWRLSGGGGGDGRGRARRPRRARRRAVGARARPPRAAAPRPYVRVLRARRP